MTRTTLKVAAASAVALGALGLGGATMALAADSTPTPSPSASASASGEDSTDGGKGDGRGQHTAVTGAEADEVIAAVEAKDSSVSVESVQKDQDGSYDALGTKDGEKVSFDVSADLATVTERTGGMKGSGGPGGPGGSQDEAVTGDEADEVVAAVEAEDPAVTIETVRKDADGSYDAIGTKDGAKVRYDVSADLATVTENAGGPAGGRHGGAGAADDAMSDPGTPGGADGTASTSETAAV